MIHWESWKGLKFDHTDKWYIHKPESVQKNEMHGNIWDFQIKKDQQIPTRSTLDLRVKIKENEMINKYLDPARELKTVENEDDGDTN